MITYSETSVVDILNKVRLSIASLAKKLQVGEMSSLPPTFVKGFHDEHLVGKMKYNRLGNTDLIVSELSIGGATLSHFYG